MNSITKYTIILMKEKGQTMRFNMRKEVLFLLLGLAGISPFIIIFLLWQITNFSMNNSALIDIVQDLQIRIDIMEAEKERYKTLDDYLADSNSLLLTSKQMIENDAIAQTNTIEQNTLPLPASIPPSLVPVTNRDYVDEHFRQYPDTTFNLGLIKVERVNFNKTREKNRRSLIFDIRNTEKDNPLNGECRFTLIKAGRVKKEVAVHTLRTTNFRINNYNQMSITLIAQEGDFEAGDIVEFSIVSNGNIIYCQNLPIVD